MVLHSLLLAASLVGARVQGRLQNSASGARRDSCSRALTEDTLWGQRGAGGPGSFEWQMSTTSLHCLQHCKPLLHIRQGVFFSQIFRKHIHEKEERHVEACLQLSAAPLEASLLGLSSSTAQNKNCKQT